MPTNPSIDRLIANCRMKIPGALDGPMIMAIFNTVSKFCIQSNILTEEQDFRTRANKRDYTMECSQPDLYYTKLLSVVRNDQETDQKLLSNPPPVKAFMVDQETLRLYDTPQDVIRLTAKFAMAPRPTDNFENLPNVPNWLWDTYHDVLIEGVMHDMMGQAAKPYSNERLSLFHGRRFQAAMSTAKVEAYNGQTLGGQHWSYPRLGW